MKTISVLIVLFFAATSFAKSPSFWKRFNSHRVEAGVEFPAQVMGRFKADYKERWYVSAGLGYSPEFFLDVYSGVIGGIGLSGQKTANLVRDSLSGSIVLDLRVGKLPRNESGMFYEGGYIYFSGGGSGTTVDDLDGLTGLGYTSVPISSLDASSTVDISADFHGGTFAAGYKYIWNNYELTGALGFIKPMIATTSVKFKSVSGTSNASQQADDLKREAESDLDDAFLTKIVIPTLSVVVVKRF